MPIHKTRRSRQSSRAATTLNKGKRPDDQNSSVSTTNADILSAILQHIRRYRSRMIKPRRTQGSPRGDRGASEPPQRTPRTQEGRPGEPKRRHWGPRAAPGEPTRRPGGPRAAPGKPKRRHGGPRAAPKDPKRHQSGPGAGPGGAKGGEKSIPGGPRTPKDAQARPRGRPQEAKGPPQEPPRTLLHASAHPPKDIWRRNDVTLRLSDSHEATREKPLVFHTFPGLGEARRANLTNHWFLHHLRGVTLAAPAPNPYF
jgi:hypothetical protein